MTAAAYFSADYAAARRRFLAAAQAQGLGVTSFLNPKAEGPAGERLFTDVAVAGPRDAPDMLVIQSATHGVEGFFGSGVQTGVLEGGLLALRPPSAKIVFIHAINPYGFAWLRRVTEDNVDLNRNFVGHGGPYPRNAGYEALKDAIAPRTLDDGSVRAANAALRDYAVAHGAFALQEAISKGQYEHSDGLYFGGHRPTWSAETWRTIVREQGRGVRRAVLIDCHTGLGETGAAEMITEAAPGTPQDRRARALWGDDAKSTKTGESVSADLTGTIDAAFVDVLPDAETTPAAIEVGTQPTDAVFRALRADNWLHLHGDPKGPDAAAIKRAIRDAFYVDTDAWKASVWGHAERILRKTLAGLAAGGRAA